MSKPPRVRPSCFALLAVALMLEMTSHGQTPTNQVNFETVYSFSGLDGSNPLAGLILAKDGSLYGTTKNGGSGYTGGSSGDGTVFRITTNGTFATVYSFAGADGSKPFGSLLQGQDGNLYGTTYQGGDSGLGTVFQLTTAGALTTLYSFTGGDDGASPSSALLQGGDGVLYGTASAGGQGFGTAYQITTNGTLTSLHVFDSFDGSGPNGLAQARDGFLYGTAVNAGSVSAYFPGTVFRLTTQGELKSLYFFRAGDGQNPEAGLVQASDGLLYGTTYGNGASDFPDFGGVFRLATDSTSFTTLHVFSGGADGSHPTAGLVQLDDGYLYGTTQGVDTSAIGGTVFRISTNGALTTLHTFRSTTESSEGANPGGGSLVKGADGKIYGTTYYGGLNNHGTIFRLTIIPAGAPAVLIQTGISASGSLALSFSTASGQSYTIEETSTLTPSNWVTYTNVTGDGSLFQLTVPTMSNTAQFFRVRQP